MVAPLMSLPAVSGIVDLILFFRMYVIYTKKKQLNQAVRGQTQVVQEGQTNCLKNQKCFSEESFQGTFFQN